PLRLLHQRALLGKFVLLAVEGAQALEFLDRSADIVRLAGGSLDPGAVRLEGTLAIFPGPVEAGDRLPLLRQPGKGIEERPVSIGVGQRPVVMLSVDLDKQLPGLPHHLDADGLVVDGGAGAAIGILDAPEDQIAVVVYAVVPQYQAGRMLARDVEDRRHLPLVSAMTHETAITTPAKSER